MIKYDLLVIGFGKAGKTLAATFGNEGKKVAVVEESSEMYGGTCINIGCIPTKTLIVAADNKKEFKDLFFSWYTGSDNERKEAEIALLLYIYEIRKDS